VLLSFWKGLIFVDSDGEIEMVEVQKIRRFNIAISFSGYSEIRYAFPEITGKRGHGA